MTTFRKAFAEFIGSFAVALIGCGCTMAFGVTNIYGVTASALAYGLTYAAAVCALSGVSEGHFHPAVSFAALIGKRLPVRAFFAYLAGQFAGALAGVGTAAAIFRLGVKNMKDNSARLGAGTIVSVGNSYTAALIAEFAVSALFVLFVLLIRRKQGRVRASVGIAAGLCFTVTGMFSLYATRCTSNPAISLSSAFYALIDGNTDVLVSVWIYFLVPFAGAALAEMIALFLRGKEKKNSPPDDPDAQKPAE